MANNSDRGFNLRNKIAEMGEETEDLAQMESLMQELEYVESEESLYSYLVAAWEHFDPAPFISNWHLEAIADHVQACFEGQI